MEDLFHRGCRHRFIWPVDELLLDSTPGADGRSTKENRRRVMERRCSSAQKEDAMKRKALLAVGVGVCVTAISYGQFLSIGPQLVFDPEAVGQIIKNIEQAVKEYNLLFQTYQTTQNTYNVLLNAANMITGKYGWQYIAAPLIYPSSVNTFGSSGGWINSLNNGLNSTIGYERATIRYSNPYAVYNFLSPQGQNDYAAHHATIELSEGTSQQAMAMTGVVRARVLQQNTALNSLEAASLSDDPANNTQVGVLNTISGASLVSAKTAQDTNNLLSAMIDIQTVEMKRRRDELVQAINDAGAFQTATQPTIDGLWSGDGAAHNARLP